jgi:aminoglycoside 6'-N-acetyltransferase
VNPDDDADLLLPRLAPGVVLRRLRPSDLTAFQAYRTDADLGRYQGWSVMSDAQARAFLEEMNTMPLFPQGEWIQLGIAAPHDEAALLGDMGLHLAEDARDHVEIGFTLSRAAQGRGLATAALRAAAQLVFESTAAERVLAITDVRNRASIGVLERAGMRRVEERQTLFRGEPCVEYVYVLLRGEQDAA